MQRIFLFFSVFSFFILFSCNTIKEKQVLGAYVPVNYTNTFDTIILMSGNIYQRKVYDKFNQLALSMSGRWYVESGTTITFNSFFSNFDRDVVKFPELLQDTSMEVSVEVSKKGKRISFCTGYYDDENCYTKLY